MDRVSLGLLHFLPSPPLLADTRQTRDKTTPIAAVLLIEAANGIIFCSFAPLAESLAEARTASCNAEVADTGVKSIMM